MAVAQVPGFHVDEREVDGVRVLSAYGELDLASAAAFCTCVDPSRFGRRRVLLDLAPLEFCDSRGLRALIGAVDELIASGGSVAVVPPRDGAVARLFAYAGASEFLPLYDGTEQALEALRR